jgi:hypothetical protein
VGHQAIPSPTRRDSSRRKAGHEDAPGCGVRTRPGRLLDPSAPVKEETDAAELSAGARCWPSP